MASDAFEKQALKELKAIRLLLEKLTGERSEVEEQMADPLRNVRGLSEEQRRQAMMRNIGR